MHDLAQCVHCRFTCRVRLRFTLSPRNEFPIDVYEEHPHMIHNGKNFRSLAGNTWTTNLSQTCNQRWGGRVPGCSPPKSKFI